MRIELAPRSKTSMTYEDALLYCQFLEYKGHRDWRMPTMDEYHRYVMKHGISWFVDDAMGGEWLVTPVRDL